MGDNGFGKDLDTEQILKGETPSFGFLFQKTLGNHPVNLLFFKGQIGAPLFWIERRDQIFFSDRLKYKNGIDFFEKSYRYLPPFVIDSV